MSWLDHPHPDSGGMGEDEYLWGDDSATPPKNVTQEEKCSEVFVNDYNLVIALSCGMLLLFGVVYSLFGYRCFKAVMFLTGFLFGFTVVYLVCLSEALLPSLGNAGVSLAAGLMFGLITMLVEYVGLFMTGIHCGLCLAVAGISIAYPWWTPGSMWVVVGILLTSGLVLAILNLYFQKGLTIIGTAVSGGALMAATLDYFVEKFLMVQWVMERLVVNSQSEQLCWFSWLILAVWPLMFIVGTLTQSCITGTGIYHTQMAPVKANRNVNLQRVRTREARAELKQKKYRYLYQVRTAHGDVISQEYIQSLQRKAYPANFGDTSGTMQSDSTHTTMLPHDHTPLAPLTESEDEGSSVPRGPVHHRLEQGPDYQLQFSRYNDMGVMPQTSVGSPDLYRPSPSPDEQYSELQYTPSPHSSSPGNCRVHPNSRGSGRNDFTPPPTPVSPYCPSPPRPTCVPR